MTRPRLFMLGIAVTAFAFAACGHSNSPSATATATPSPAVSVSASSTPCSLSLGIAYEPDAGNGGSFNGVQTVHYEDNSGALCSQVDIPPTPRAVTFQSSVEQVAFSSDASDAVALIRGASGNYTQVQDVFGSSVGALVPVGAPYDLTTLPTPQPTASGASASPTPVSAPLLSDAQSVALLGNSNLALALVAGQPIAGPTPGIYTLTSLTNAPPQFGNGIPFSGSTYTLQNIPNVTRNIVRTGADGNGHVTIIARGPQDLLTFGVTLVATGYQFDAKAEDATLGTSSTFRGRGVMDIDPADTQRALIGGTTDGHTNRLTLVTGLPGAITHTYSLDLAGNIKSIAITSAGVYALVGTDVGFYVVGGIDSTTLTLVTPFATSPDAAAANALSYNNCNGVASSMTDVHSIDQSADARFLVALGTSPGTSCASGYNDSIVVIPFNPATGSTPAPSPSPAASSSASPAPVKFVQNNVIAPPTGGDFLYAR